MNYKENEKYRRKINKYFKEFQGIHSTEQTFYILLGTSIIIWAKMKGENVQSCDLDIHRLLSESEEGYYLLQEDIENLESGRYEFNGSLREVFDKAGIYKSKSSKKGLGYIFGIINSTEFSSVDDVRGFINKLVETGKQGAIPKDIPRSIRTIIIALVEVKTVKDFAEYGSGTSLLAVDIFEQLKHRELNREVFYYGEESDTRNYVISKLLMVVNGVDQYQLVNKHPLEYTKENSRMEFDFAVCDISQKQKVVRDHNMRDFRFNDNKFSGNSTDWIFIENLLDHLKHNGKGVAVGTKGTLVRGSEDNIRRYIIEDDLIEAVITLPDNLYEKSTIGTELIIFNQSKARDRGRQVLFINASKFGNRLNKNQHTISPEGITKILECYRYGFEEAGFSKFVTLEKMREYDYRLNPIEYLEFDVLKNSLINSVSLKEIAQISNGVQITKKDMEQLSKEPIYYFLNIKDINEGEVTYDEATRLTFKKKDWIGKYDIQPEDILITSKGWAVKVAIVEKEFKRSFISGNLTRIRVDPREYNPYVLYEFLNSEIGAKMMEGLQTGTTIKLLNNSQLERLEVPMFSKGFMDEVGLAIKSNKREYERKIEEATKTFKKRRLQLVEDLGWKISKYM